MPFNENSQLDTTQVQDRRGGGGIPGGGLVVGGGAGGIIMLIIALVLGINPGSIGTQTADQPAQNGDARASSIAQECKTGADANTKADCRIVGYANSIQKYWSDEFSRRGARYQISQTVLFSQATDSACGTATTDVGPFYCPEDRLVYLDLTFFDELRQRVGAQGGSFAEGYVVAHEYGHHIQDLAGLLGSSQGGRGQNSDSVRTELQADCFAGVWAANAAKTGLLTAPSETEIRQALDAAASVGDDRIQRRTQGRVNPDAWTHGSSEQRQRWFMTGLQSGNMDNCDTSRGNI